MPHAIGIDVGGTKIAAGLVDLRDGRVLAQRQQPTKPGRGGQAVFDDVAVIASELIKKGHELGSIPESLGIGVAEIVSPNGEVLTEGTIAWEGIPVREKLSNLLPTVIEADVRAAALAEARLGSGQDLSSFVYVTIGTGISSCLVLNGQPFRGARGMTGTFASAPGLMPVDLETVIEGPPLEEFSSGPALATRFTRLSTTVVQTPEVISLAESGNPIAREVVDSAGRALGAAIAQLVNILDPLAVVIGGGLGRVGGLFHNSVERAMREHIWCELHRKLPLKRARLGPAAGLIGAALASELP